MKQDIQLDKGETTTRHRKISKNLPVELLLIIFEFLYKDQDIQLDKGETRYLMSPSLFPYAPASVCSLWRDTMSLVPKFWRRVVILIDTPATRLSAIVSQLTWSRDCDSEVIVTQRNLYDRDAVKGPHERSNMISIMKILGSHMHRIRELRFYVAFSSSLPSFPADFHGAAIILERLYLQCIGDDGGPDFRTWVAPTEHEEFKCPRIRMLVLNYGNYREVCRRDVQWTSKTTIFRYMMPSRFSPRPGESFTRYVLLHPLAEMVDPEVLYITDYVSRPPPYRLQFDHYM
jgi:hypothetical protein